MNRATEDAGEDISPEMAQDAQGNRVIVWYSNDSLQGTGGDNDILFVRSGGVQAITGFRTEQRTRISSAGDGHQMLIYNYESGTGFVSAYANNTSTVSYSLPADEWVGIFLYDYHSAAFTEAVYRVKDGLL